MSLPKANTFLILLAIAVLAVGMALLLLSNSLHERYELWIGARHAAAGEYGLAVQHYRIAAAMSPHEPNAHLLAAKAFAATHDVDGALAEYRAVLAVDVANFDALVGLGRLLADREQVLDAVDYLRMASELRPSDTGLRNELGIALSAIGDFQGARQTFGEVLGAVDASGELAKRARFWLAMVLAADDSDSAYALLADGVPDGSAGQLAKSLSELLRTRLQRGAAEAAYYAGRLGQLYLQANWLAPARLQFERALAARPDYGDAEAFLGIVYCQQERRDEGLAHLARSQQLEPNAALPYYFEGVCRRGADEDGAAAALRKATELDRSDSASRWELARAFSAAGAYTDAAAAYEEALALDSRNFALLEDTAAFYLSHLFRLDRGLDLAKQALDLAPDRWEAGRALALALALKGNVADAIALLEKEPAGGDAAGRELQLGELYRQIGETKAAKAHFRRAGELDPSRIAEQARAALGELQ